MVNMSQQQILQKGMRPQIKHQYHHKGRNQQKANNNEKKIKRINLT
jgi:hypothetical protein